MPRRILGKLPAGISQAEFELPFVADSVHVEADGTTSEAVCLIAIAIDVARAEDLFKGCGDDCQPSGRMHPDCVRSNIAQLLQLRRKRIYLPVAGARSTVTRWTEYAPLDAEWRVRMQRRAAASSYQEAAARVAGIVAGTTATAPHTEQSQVNAALSSSLLATDSSIFSRVDCLP